jgi:CBS domain-containing protein
MRVSDILRVKGGTLYTCHPNDALTQAVETMAAYDIGSLAVMEHGDLVGMLTFRELIHTLASNGGTVSNRSVRVVMDDHPISCTPETELEQVRPLMLERHTRYMPVMDNRMLMGVISFYDVARAVVDSQNFENKMLKAYIRDWPEEEKGKSEPNLP